MFARVLTGLRVPATLQKYPGCQPDSQLTDSLTHSFTNSPRPHRRCVSTGSPNWKIWDKKKFFQECTIQNQPLPTKYVGHCPKSNPPETFRHSALRIPNSAFCPTPHSAFIASSCSQLHPLAASCTIIFVTRFCTANGFARLRTATDAHGRLHAPTQTSRIQNSQLRLIPLCDTA
jgi:hypothetical protein